MIETERLIIKPLTYNQLLKYVRCDGSLEQELGLKTTERVMPSELKEAFAQTILPNVCDERNNYLYHTLWTAIAKSEGQMVGDFCFVGEPDEMGKVEIGYGTYGDFQGRNFMTEIVGGMIRWARAEPAIKFLIASTEKNNAASFRVLEKNGFIKSGETETLYQWQLELTREIVVRQETEADRKAVFSINQMAYGRNDEAVFVDIVRRSEAFIPELSLIAIVEGTLAGHIVFSKNKIIHESGIVEESLSLAPLAVKPEFQNMGVGRKLVLTGFERARTLGFKSVIVLGHKDYYPKFGFAPAENWNIRPPFSVPSNSFMALELMPNALKKVSGVVKYPKEFETI